MRLLPRNTAVVMGHAVICFLGIDREEKKEEEKKGAE